MSLALGGLVLSIAASGAVGCSIQSGRSSGPGAGYAQPGPGAPAGRAPGGGNFAGGFSGGGGVAPVEVYMPRAPRMSSGAYLQLPGMSQRQLVRYDIVDGMAVMEGDIVLGPATTVMQRYGGAGPQDPNVKRAVGVSNQSQLWPGGVIPYEIDGSVPQSTRGDIAWAVAEVGQTPLKLRPRTPADRDYVVFRDTGNGCTSYIGKIGGPQTISTTGCARGSVAHEILHAAGFYHEQSRGDRDQHVTIVWDEISPAYRSNFETRPGTAQDIGTYDYASIMHYSASAFSKSGKPTIIPKSPGAQIGQRNGLSALDKAAVAQLYAGGPIIQPSQPQQPGQPQQPQQPQAAGLFAGNYSSQQGPVSCGQNGGNVQCSFGGGSLWCTASGNDLSCAWGGSAGQGRAVFQRQANGVLTGTWGDVFSVNSRGAWDLTPSGGAPQQPGPAQPAQPNPFPFPWPGGVTPPQLPPIQAPFPLPWQQ